MKRNLKEQELNLRPNALQAFAVTTRPWLYGYASVPLASVLSGIAYSLDVMFLVDDGIVRLDKQSTRNQYS